MVLFPKKDALSGTERLALSVGISAAVTPLIVLLLNYTPWGIRVYPIVITLDILIFVLSLIGWHRWQKLDNVERFRVSFNLNWLEWREQQLSTRVLLIALVFMILVTVSIFGYITVKPKVGEKYTEFYILGSGGKTQDYPTEIKAGEETGVSAVVINHEHEDITYHVAVVVEGERIAYIGPIVLEHDGNWEQEVSFRIDKPGREQKVEFILYKGDNAYRSLYLRVNVLP
jgi:uncharacterized membrane protein